PPEVEGPGSSRPSRMWYTASAAPTASARWLTTTTAAPARARARNASRITRPLASSRLPVGSSASSRGGSLSTARQKATRWRSPPTITSPPSASSSRPTTFSRVLLPEPDAPSTRARRPCGTARSTPSRTRIGAPPGARYDFTSARASSTAADRLGRGQAHDPQGRVGGRRRAQQQGEHEAAAEQPAREEEELLAAPGRPAVDTGAEHDGQRHADRAAGERHRQRFAEHL